LLETFQVLTGKIYQLSMNKAAKSILKLVFNSRIFFIQEEKIHHLTLKLLEKNKVDYTDAFLTAKAIINQGLILSFDQDLDKLASKIRICL
jgi:predicted nucleic-acid-binding protein